MIALQIQISPTTSTDDGVFLRNLNLINYYMSFFIISIIFLEFFLPCWTQTLQKRTITGLCCNRFLGVSLVAFLQGFSISFPLDQRKYDFGMSVCLSVCLSGCLSVCHPIFLSAYLPVFLSVCLSAFMSDVIKQYNLYRRKNTVLLLFPNISPIWYKGGE